MKTAANLLPDLLGPEAKPFDLRFSVPGGDTWPFAHMLLVSNNPYQLEHLIGSGKRPRMDTGRLGIAAARINGPSEAVQFMALESSGQIRRFAGWTEWDAATFRVDSTHPIEIGIDGEAIRLDPPLLFESLPKALVVHLARGVRAPGATGQSAHLTRAGVASLISIAAGRGGPS
jgi:diacylglycerol kinase family enzyme